MTSKKMETKNPKTRLLFTILILAVCLFVGIKFGLDSYWSITTNAYAEELLPPTTELNELRAKQKKDLESSPTPINAAIQDMAVKGRNSNPVITPQPSNDLDPLRGWSQTKKEIAEPPPPVPTAVPALAADGGVAVPPGDAGVLPLATDAGTTRDGAAPAPRGDGGT